MSRILFICKRRLDDYGNSFGLLNSANFVANFLNARGTEAKAIMVDDNNAIDKEVTDYDPTHVFIEALWVTSEKLRELMSLKRHQDRQWTVRIHSKFTFLANEGIAFSWLGEYVKLTQDFENFTVAPNSHDVAVDLKRTLGLRTTYLPNIYKPPTYESCDAVEDKEHYVDVGCFGAIRPMKNQLIQAIAAIEFANKINKTLRFHINASRQEQRGEQVYKNLKALFKSVEGGHQLVEHQWIPHKEFITLIRQMDIGIQVSLSETFNIVAADFVDNGIPVIGSSEIEWLPCFFKADAHSANNITETMLFAYKFRSVGLHYLSNIYLYSYNKHAEKEWLDFLCSKI